MKKCIWGVVFFLCFTGIVYAADPDLGETISRPVSRMIHDVVNGVAAVSNIDLTVGEYSIKGKVVKGKKKKPLEGVLLTLGGDKSLTTVTNEKGKFRFLLLQNGDYTLTPSLDGYKFKPESRFLTIDDKDKKKVKFKAKKRKTKNAQPQICSNLSSPPVLPVQTEDSLGWPYGEPDEEGYYTINGYQMRFYDDSDEIITNMVTGFLFVAKIEIKIELENDGIIVEGSIFVSTGLPVTYPIVVEGIFIVTMDSGQYGSSSATIELLELTFIANDADDSEGIEDSELPVMFSSGSLSVFIEGAYSLNSITVSYVTDGIVNVFENSVGGAIAVEYTLTGDSINTSGAGDLSITVYADGTGSYSSSNEFIGSGTF